MVIAESARDETIVKTKRIDGDTHFNLTFDYKELKDLLPRHRMPEAQDMMWRDGERFANPNGVRVEVDGPVGPRPSTAPIKGDPTRDPDARVEQIDKLGFDMQVQICSTAMPAPLRPGGQAAVAEAGPGAAVQQRIRQVPGYPPGSIHLPRHRALG